MKTIYKTSFLSFLAVILLMLNACDDSSDLFEVSTPVAPVLSDLSLTDIELDANNTNNPALTLTWKEAEYGQQVAINYAVEFSSDDTFTNPSVATTTSGINNVTFSTGELNTAAGNAGLNPFNWATVYVRIVSSLGAQKEVISISNTIQFRVYPYYNYVFEDYFLVGDSTAPGWNNNDNNPALFRDPNSSKKFYYTGYFNNGYFKVLETKGLWQPQWGTDDGSTIGVNPGGGTDPERFPDAGGAGITAGYYQFTIDFGAKTFEFTPFNETGSTSYTGMSIQGSATTGGNNPTAINQLAHDKHIWYMNNIHLTPGDVTFITNTSTTFGSTTSFSGTATENGGSIPVIVEDDYDVWFNDLTGHYVLIPLNL